MDNNVQNDINKVIENIDAKMEEVKSDSTYNEEEGRKQVDAMYDYMKDHPQSTDSLLNPEKKESE